MIRLISDHIPFAPGMRTAPDRSPKPQDEAILLQEWLSAHAKWAQDKTNAILVADELRTRKLYQEHGT